MKTDIVILIIVLVGIAHLVYFAWDERNQRKKDRDLVKSCAAALYTGVVSFFVGKNLGQQATITGTQGEEQPEPCVTNAPSDGPGNDNVVFFRVIDGDSELLIHLSAIRAVIPSFSPENGRLISVKIKTTYGDYDAAPGSAQVILQEVQSCVERNAILFPAIEGRVIMGRSNVGVSADDPDAAQKVELAVAS